MLVDNYSRIIALLLTLFSLIALSFSTMAFERVQAPQSTQTPTPLIQFNPLIDESIFINSNMLFMETSEETDTIHELLALPQHWQTIKRSSPNFGFTSTAYWFKFNIDNMSNTHQPIFLELPIPFLDSIKLYQVVDNQILQHYDLGDLHPFSQRPVNHQNFVMPITLSPGLNEIFMRVSSSGTVEAPLTLWVPQAHAESSAETNLMQGIWMGMLGIMVIYNFLLFLSIKDKSYLYYVLFAFGFLFFQASLKGYGFAYIWPNLLSFNNYAISTFIALSNLSVIMLVIHFLNLKKSYPRIHRFMLTMAIIAGSLFVATFVIPYSITIRATSLMTIATCTISLILGYYTWFKGYRDARYYCLAWTATFIGIGVLLLVKFGLISANFWTNNAGQIGVITLVSLLSFALANRINKEKEMRLQAQNEALLNEKLARQSQEELLNAQAEANNQLEDKVEERTRSMQKIMDELEHANSRLELASITDSLTTLFNRGHFDNRLAVEYKRAIRHKRELSIILCDIDHFKNINDTFGHKVGDDCLRHVALILKNTITRSGDIIARYGGEEFIILLVDTPLQEAENLAKTLCHSFRTTSIDAKNQQIQFTASFGVTSLSQAQVENTDILVNHADEALYDAKNKGRDQVCIWQQKS
ncbi:MAG: 7TM diverse intracellular signaling domain-containing protein [Oleiphilus sp.]